MVEREMSPVCLPIPEERNPEIALGVSMVGSRGGVTTGTRMAETGLERLPPPTLLVSRSLTTPNSGTD